MLKVYQFIRRMLKASVHQVIKFFHGLYTYAEAIFILILAALGVNALLSEIPFIFALPLWIEATMVIPFISVVIVSILLHIAKYRGKRRRMRMAYAA